MLGILVHGGNHFIVRGPMPDRRTALELTRIWSVIQIGQPTPPELREWTISSREFREDLQWAIRVKGDDEISSAVAMLLDEMAGRGVFVHDADQQDW